MSHSTTTRLQHQIFRLNQQERPDLDFGLGEILSPEDLALILTEEGATWKTIIYTPLLTTWAFLWQMLSPDRSCRAAVKRIAAWLSSQGQKLANDEDDPYIKARRRLPETVPLRLMKHLDRWLGQHAPATWALDVSQARLWCRCAPPQPPSPGAVRHEPTSGGWGSMPQRCGPWTCRRRTCVSLHSTTATRPGAVRHEPTIRVAGAGCPRGVGLGRVAGSPVVSLRSTPSTRRKRVL